MNMSFTRARQICCRDSNYSGFAGEGMRHLGR
jgi:hypothetical protein